MINVRLLNKSGKLVKSFHDLKEAYMYAAVLHIEEFSIQTTLIRV